MSESFLNGRVTLHCGDCLDVLATLPENSIDSCVTDPPYHLVSIVKRYAKGDAKTENSIKLHGTQKVSPYMRGAKGFMGKQWDGGDIAQSVELWSQVYRVLKPGAHLLAFGGTRTQHRMVCAIEDAGFEIRDMILYLYGSGFPKSHSVTKGLGDAICLCEAIPERELRPVRNDDVSPSINVGEKCGEILFESLPQQGASGAMLRSQSKENSFGSEKSSVEGRDNVPQSPRELRQREIRPMSAESNRDGETGRLRDGTSSSNGCMDWPSIDADGMCASQGPPTAEQSTNKPRAMAMQSQPQISGAWPTCGRCGKPIVPDGYGTALKPACEPIVLARKPLSERTVASNVLRWGVGVINIDGCRIETSEQWEGRALPDAEDGVTWGGALNKQSSSSHPSWRWPANVITDGSKEVVGAFPDAKGAVSNGRKGKQGLYEDGIGASEQLAGYADEGSTARFFYQVKQDDDVHSNLLESNGPYIAEHFDNPMFECPLCGADLSESSHADNCTWPKRHEASRLFYTSKAGSDDRLGSKHPTVKPLDLIQYLIRLVTPKGGTVIDPFAGTGTTGEAAWREGMNAVLIEREAEYQADIRRRMELCLSGPDERQRESIKAKLKDKPLDHGPLFGATA